MVIYTKGANVYYVSYNKRGLFVTPDIINLIRNIFQHNKPAFIFVNRKNKLPNRI